MKKLRKENASDIIPRLEAIAQNLSTRNSEESVNYSNREIDEKFSDIQTSLGRIEAQTIKTNGHVADLIKWKYITMGFCGCITIMVLPLLWSLIQSGRL